MTMPPSSTPACCTLVMESAEASAAAFAAGAADIRAPMPAESFMACAERRSPSRLRASAAQRLNRSEISCSLANAVRVFPGAACAPAVASMMAAKAEATATRSNF
ncbi:hypothetical protein D3C83_05360 [compost metagenome]